MRLKPTRKGALKGLRKGGLLATIKKKTKREGCSLKMLKMKKLRNSSTQGGAIEPVQ